MAGLNLLTIGTALGGLIGGYDDARQKQQKAERDNLSQIAMLSDLQTQRQQREGQGFAFRSMLGGDAQEQQSSAAFGGGQAGPSAPSFGGPQPQPASFSMPPSQSGAAGVTLPSGQPLQRISSPVPAGVRQGNEAAVPSQGDPIDERSRQVPDPPTQSPPQRH